MLRSQSKGDEGSAPLETSTVLALLLIPITPLLAMVESVFDAIAAESIARHALRYSILKSSDELQITIGNAVELLARSWEKEVTFTFDCGMCGKGSLATLTVKVGDSVAIQVAGLEPK